MQSLPSHYDLSMRSTPWTFQLFWSWERSGKAHLESTATRQDQSLEIECEGDLGWATIVCTQVSDCLAAVNLIESYLGDTDKSHCHHTRVLAILNTHPGYKLDYCTPELNSCEHTLSGRAIWSVPVWFKHRVHINITVGQKEQTSVLRMQTFTSL